MKLLGIDYGDKKIGIAISEGFLAEPQQVIQRKNAEKIIKRIVEEKQINKIIIGISEGKSAEKAEDFKKIVEKCTNVVIESWDETNTTINAIQAQISSGKKRSKRKRQEDAVAAALILQSYIDSQIK